MTLSIGETLIKINVIDYIVYHNKGGDTHWKKQKVKKPLLSLMSKVIN